MRAWFVVAMVVAGCGDASVGVDTGVDVDTSVGVDASAGVDTSVDVDASAGVDVVPEIAVSDELDARSYCESTVDLFCPYYMRCGRMAVADVAACRVAFLESCNERYEPAYAALADRGALSLSRAGIERCATHLATVACEQQLFDLDGGCAGIWRGQVATGACGLGIESFICDETATCVIGLDFCGTCKPIVAADTACDFDHRCPDDGTCREGDCVPRVGVGDVCDDQASCVLGASCDGVCVAPTIVALGESCDQAHRCPYKSACVAGKCASAALLGAPCGVGGCASGACRDNTCVPLLDTDEPCTSAGGCRSGRCVDGHCSALTSSCLE